MVAAKLRTFLCTPNKTLLALPSVAGTLTRGLTHFVRILAHVLAPQSLALRCEESQTVDVEKAKEKSQLKQLMFTTLFGPLGLFYSNNIIAVFLSIFIIPSILAFGFGLFFGWPFSMLVGVICVRQHNIKVQPFLEFQKRKAQYEQGRINGNA